MMATTACANAASFYDLIRRAAGNRWLKWLGGLAAVAAVIGSALSDPPPPMIPPVVLAAEPLYARGARAKPTLTLALSVEFPTVGAQYVAAPGATDDASYSSATEYVGYFDPTSCYAYNDTPAVPTGSAVADYKRFDLSGAAATSGSGDSLVSLRTCDGTKFSGNFLNWAGSSAIDILRYGLTGGDRVIDTVGLTVLQRAVLPAGKFWNDQNFPSKQINAATAAGALPSALLAGYSGTVYVANCYNRIHFGTAKTGSCDNPGANSNLGVTTGAGATIGPITAFNSTLPAGYSACAGENGTCSFAGTMQVYYGANSSYKTAGATGPVSCSNNTFGDPLVGVVKQCYVGPNQSGWTPPSSSTNALTADGFFYDRVSVCSTDVNGALVDPRVALCLRYPGGNYKPVGNLQKYSDSIRVSAFGYLNDSTGNPNERYGGVLRAPMKYVGPKYYDANFSLVSGVNPNREWDETTGIFIPNPDAQNTPSGPGSSPSGPPLSGVTNYLNQFGRTGGFGAYKTYDPPGELYYEALRYLQGLPPTPAATDGLTTAMKDGFPIFTTWADPHPAVPGSTDYSCVKNNILAIGDVNTHNDKSFPGNPASRGTNENTFTAGRPADKTINEPDFHYWTQVVGGFESGNAVGYLDGQGASRTTSNFNAPTSAEAPITSLAGMADANIGADGASYYMAGAAYWANTHDIRGSDWSDADKRRPGMRVSTYVLDVNEFAQQTSQSAHRQNQFYLASKYGGFTDNSRTGNPYLNVTLGNDNANWERPGPGNMGETNNYYLASSAKAVLAGLDTIFANVAHQANSIAGGASSTTQVSSGVNGGGFVYQAQFDPAAWSGDLLAYSVTAATDNTVAIQTLPTWKAATTLDATDPDARNIVVGKTTPGGSPKNFLWSQLDSSAKASLQSPVGVALGGDQSDAAGQARLDFLRGVRSNEAPNGLGFRKRVSVLGDIVNSGVTFSGTPTLRFNDPLYTAFYNSNATRKRALFVGANDGMLHAFDPDNNGAELFAYIPSWVVPRIGALTFPNYTHQSYVDATPVVADAVVNGAWKTVLVGGSGGGGRGVYALDVSKPDAFAAGNVLWEFNVSDDPEFDLGNVVGRPQILKLRTGTSAAPAYKYFAVVASGVDNYVDDGHDHFSTTGRSAIYLLDLSKAASDNWAEGTNFFKIRFPTPASGAGTIANGMIGFSVVTGNADEVAQIYAGDLQGKLWKLDFTLASAGSAGWNLNTLSYYKNGSTPVPMYQAIGPNGKPQPITMEPAVVYGSNKARYIAFGTGKFLELPDVQGPFNTQSVYALLDNGSSSLDNSMAGTAAISGRGRLQAGTVDVSTGLVNIASFVLGRPLTDADTSKRSGWYFDFPVSGERQISNAAVLSGELQFGSIIPPVSSCDDGAGNIYSINIFNGSGKLLRSPVGLVGQPFAEQVNASVTTATDSTGRVTVTTHYQTIVQGAQGLNSPNTATRNVITYAGRLNWREVSNYQQLKGAPP